DISSPPCLPRLLPAGAVAGRGLHPLDKRRLVTAHVVSGPSAQRVKVSELRRKLSFIGGSVQSAISTTADVRTVQALLLHIKIACGRPAIDRVPPAKVKVNRSVGKHGAWLNR